MKKLSFLINGFKVNAIITGISRITGFVRDIFLAFFLGSGIHSDLFLISSKIPNLFRRITAEGAITSSFLPIYSKHLNSEESDVAQRFSSIVFLILVLFLAFLVTCLEIFMPLIASMIAPGLAKDEKIFNDIVYLTRITILFLPLISVTAFLGAMLNASGRFLYFALTPILFNLTIVFSCFFIAENLKIKCLPLAVAMPISGLIQLIFLLYYINKFKLITRLFFSINNFRKRSFEKIKIDLYDTLKRFIPSVLIGGVFQLNILVDTILASLVGIGAVSFLYYADRIIQLPLGVIGVSLSTVLIASLSRPQLLSNNKEISIQLEKAIKISLFFSIPSMLVLIHFSDFIIKGLFERGSFDLNSTKSTAFALQLYSIGLPFIMILKCIQSVFIALGKMKKILIISILQLLLNIVFSIWLMKELKHGGIALATSLSTIIAFVLYLILIIREKKLTYGSIYNFRNNGLFFIIFYFIKISIISIIMVYLIKLIKNYLVFDMDIINICVFAIFGALIYIIITYVTKQIPKELISKLK